MNDQPLEIRNVVDENGNPAGGSVYGTGLTISWQDGPLGRGENRTEPNGAFVETVLRAVRSRLEFYERSKFACDENANALIHVDRALRELEQRTRRREAEGNEGTHMTDVPEAMVEY